MLAEEIFLLGDFLVCGYKQKSSEKNRSFLFRVAGEGIEPSTKGL